MIAMDLSCMPQEPIKQSTKVSDNLQQIFCSALLSQYKKKHIIKAPGSLEKLWQILPDA